MFYASEVLSLRNRSALAVLYYVSTTNNRGRRINKRDIEDIDIADAISSMQEPERPFALRLYSFLLKGVVRIYKIKVTSCQAELHSLLSSMLSSRRPKRGAKKARVGADVLRTEDDVISNICSHDAEEPSYEMLCSGSEISVDFGGEEGPRVEKRCGIRKAMIDDETELDRDRIYLTETQGNRKPMLEVKPMNGTFIVDRINEICVGHQRDSSLMSGDSNAPGYSSVERVRNSSLASFRSNLGGEVRSDEWEFLGFTSTDLNFDEVAVGGKRFKSLAFYKILELATTGVVKPQQSYPYGPIVLKPADN
jgi:hypothetical protein